MKITFKKSAAFILSVLTAFSAFAVFSLAAEEPEIIRRSAQEKAISVNAGYTELLNSFSVASSNGRKYAFYNPVIDENDETKYPVVIYVHGLFHGWTDSSFKKSGLTYWACSEMQDKFVEGGAHLIMPKIPEYIITGTQTGKVFELILGYVAFSE